jgi:proline iminopeptidase
MNSDSYTIEEHYIEVGDGHSLYVQDWGNKQAKKPIVFLHGGPGAGISDNHKATFNPSLHRVIFFDQRGAGKSLCTDFLKNNTTDYLIRDINTITSHLGIRKFIITGGSWGSCLALSYAIKYPKKVFSMVLRGIFTGTQTEIDYLDKGQFKIFFPDVWERYLERTPKKHHKNPSQYHYKNIASQDPELIKKSAYAYGELEGALLRIDDRHTPLSYDDFDPKMMQIELHYLGNACFLPAHYIMKNAHTLTMPITLVQGRYDTACPPSTAYALHNKLPNSQLIWTLAGHSGSDRANYDALKLSLDMHANNNR